MDIVNAGMGIASAPGNFVGSTMRHGFDVPTFGQLSDRYNARDEYRNEYDNVERTGAALGVTGATALTAGGAVLWAKNGLPVRLPSYVAQDKWVTRLPIAGKGVPLPSPRALAVGVGVAAGAGILATGASKTKQILQDDGNWGALGMGAGLLGGGVAGAKLVGKLAPTRAPIGAVVGMVGGAVAGKLGANHVTVGLGDGHLGERIPTEKNVDASLADRAGSFTQGAWNHFSEVGPMSQGSSGAKEWGLQDHFEQDYSNAERAGGMHGDLAAAGIMGTAALGVGAAVTGMKSRVGKDGAPMSKLNAAADDALRLSGGSRLRGTMAQMAPAVLPNGMASKAGIAAAIGTGTALTAYTALREARTWGDGEITSGGGLAAAGAVVGLTGAGALAIAARRTAGKPFAPAAAGGMLAAAALIGVGSAVRQPLQQFHRDQKSAHGLEPGTDWATAAVAGGALGVAGGIGGRKLAGKLVPADGIKLPKIPKLPQLPTITPKAGRIAGLAIGGAAAAYVGYGLSSTMPSLDKVGVAAGVGAAVGGAGALALRGSAGSRVASKVAIGAVTGGALGMTASALAKDDASAAGAAATSVTQR